MVRITFGSLLCNVSARYIAVNTPVDSARVPEKSRRNPDRPVVSTGGAIAARFTLFSMTTVLLPVKGSSFRYPFSETMVYSIKGDSIFSHALTHRARNGRTTNGKLGRKRIFRK